LKLQWTRLEKYKSGFSFFLCFLGHVIWHRSEIIYYLIWPIYPCVSIALPGMSTVCTWGTRGIFF
jgi:hypothetical protein